jgi:C4-dicarboxylate-specific signal transduction histidine kinase
VTQQNILSKELQELNESLEQRIEKALGENTKHLQMLQQQSQLAAMGEMIGAIAHQWKQPLNTLAINVQNLEDDYADNLIDAAFVAQFVENNHHIIRFMSDTVDDFKNFFRKDKSKCDFFVKLILKDVLKIQDTQLKNHAITCTIKGDDFVVHGYKNEFKQVLLNIINNAKDAIVAHPSDEDIIEIVLAKRTITVIDSGGGIPVEIMYRIFEPYFTTKPLNKGTGLGLYISKMIIEENFGGTLQVENRGRGAAFIITPVDIKDEDV